MYEEQCGEDACWCSGLKGLSQEGQADCTKDAWGHGQKGASSRVLFLLLGLKEMEVTALQDNQY